MNKKKRPVFSGKCEQAVIFARVSSREQEQGASIDAQIDTDKNYCDKRGLSVIKIFSITESSTRGKRPEFYEMIDFVKKQKNKVAIVVNCVDRLQRTNNESPILDELRKEGKIEIHFLREGLVINKDSLSADIMIWDMFVLMAKAAIASLIDHVKRSQKYNWEQGRWQSHAPLGYINVRDASGKAGIEVDPDRAPLVRSLFEAYATGLHTLKSMSAFAKEINLCASGKNHTIQKNEIHRILTNPFYYGLMRVNGQLLPHIYTPLIEKSLFDTVQDTMRGKKHALKGGYGEIPYTFRGLVRCATCGCVMSPETKVKKSGKSYTYLKCGHNKGPCCQKPVREYVLFDQLEDEVFSNIDITPAALDVLKKNVRSYIEKKADLGANTKKGVELRIVANKETMNRLLDLYIKGKVNETVYTTKSAELDAERAELQGVLAKYNEVGADLTETAEAVLDIAGNARNLMSGPNLTQKRALLNLLLSDCSLEGKRLCFSLQKPFDKLFSAKGCLSWLGRRDSNPNKENQNLLSYH